MLKRLPLAILLAGAGSAWAQQVISAHSGVIHFVEGQVTLEGQPVQPKFAEFPDVKNGQTLAAQDGRVEVLLTPGVILRLGENSSFKMISNSRADTRLEILTGEAVIEVGELLPSNAITLISGKTHIELLKRGLYRFEAEDPGKLRVYEGEARVTAGEQTLLARKGRQVQIGAVLDMTAFDVKDMDALLRWAARRSEYLAQANVSSAKSASSLGYLGSGSGSGSWAYNPWYGMFTFMPYGNGMYYNPFGYPFYSPTNVSYFTPGNAFSRSGFPLTSTATSPHYNNSNGTYNMGPRPSSGSSSFNSTSAAAAAANGFSGGSASSSSGLSGGSASHAGGGGGGAATSGRGK